MRARLVGVLRAVPIRWRILSIAALNSANEPVAERGQKLYVVNPTVDPDEMFVAGADLETLIYEGMSIEEVDQEIEQVLVVADERFISASRDLESLESKRAFLIGYWRAQDTDPNPNVNTARDTFFRRLSIVQDRSREPLTPGFRTERGRVFLKYGPPSEIDRNLVNTETIPYEIWTYESIPGEGRSMFVFADRLSTGNMELIHSDVTGEISRPNWEGDLYRIR
ncbi:MAG TPA: GWxTD domain-containing protein [Bacteroidetes bacterium]|nr:GWxTD domain-containing protein [Bacteroidota bacterium]